MTVHDAGMVNRHEKLFDRIESRISALEGKMVAAESLLDRLDSDMYNHGQDGLKTVFTRFVAESETRETERANALAQHNSSVSLRIGVIGIVLALLTLAVAWMAYVDTRDKVDKGLLRLPHISHAEQPDFYADKQQDATIPPMTR